MVQDLKEKKSKAFEPYFVNKQYLLYLLVLPRFLGVGHGEEVVLTHEPVTQTAVLDH
jgi:hypothetical protein